MEEGQVTVDGHTYRLGPPFMVIATQNPIELEGTYPLPEAQLDRFLMRIEIGYPDRDAEVGILEADRGHVAAGDLAAIITEADLLVAGRAIGRVHVAEGLREYIVAIADATRRHPALTLGASPRGALCLQRAARAWAAAAGRDFVLPDDIKRLAAPVLAHRLVPNVEADLRGIDGPDVIAELLNALPVPGATG
jgi:MoxR-like ATPase